MRPPTETIVRAVDYTDDATVLHLGRPNVSVKMPPDGSADDPDLVAWQLRKQHGGRHQAYGRAFDDLTRGRKMKRWQELKEVAPLGIDGVFIELGTGNEHSLDEVLSNG